MAETIYALSSGVGRAGVAVVRVSGPNAGLAARQLVRSELAPRKAALTSIFDPQTNDLIDRALALWFPGPNSFTGEDVAELHVHGGRAVVAAVLSALSSFPGLRAAEPGEFTRRAFAAGKLDLSSAEGLGDLIAADTELQRRQAIKQFTGSARERGLSWRRSLIEALALLEAHLDFPDEEEIPADVIEEVSHVLALLIQSFDKELQARSQAEIIRDGAVVLIAGPPNSGKSSLLNRIVAREVAIISDIPGTTRDLIEVTLNLRGVPVTFIDSAGIRDTADPIESQGIARTLARAEKADLVLWLTPADKPPNQPDLVHSRLWMVRSKTDLVDESDESLASTLRVSAETGEGVPELLDFVYDSIVPRLNAVEPGALSSQRQFECVEAAKLATGAAIDRLAEAKHELAAEELRFAARRLEEMIGLVCSDDLLDEVFGRFCLGK